MSNGTDAGRGSRVAGRGYQQLRAWQKAHELALAAFKSAERFKTRNRSVADQFTRSAVSVPANIAEGYNRGSLREYIQFLTIARGSLAETEYYIIFTKDAGLLTADEAKPLTSLADDAGNLLLGLIRSLRTKEGGKGNRMVRDDGIEYETNAAADSATRDPTPATQPEAS
jgi:four helix bundle protein